MSHIDYILQKSRNYRKKDHKLPTKVVIRRLPPNFTLEILKLQIFPLPEHNYIYFVNADKHDGFNAFSRVYINFVRHEDVYNFREKYDNYVFLGAKGSEYPVVVEYAPFQKVPKERHFYRKDVKCGTIQKNEYYLKFIENLKKSNRVTAENPVFDMQIKSTSSSEDTTPLLRYITERRVERSRTRWESEAVKQKRPSKKDDNCIIFINSAVKNRGHRKFNLKTDKQKFVKV